MRNTLAQSLKFLAPAIAAMIVAGPDSLIAVTDTPAGTPAMASHDESIDLLEQLKEGYLAAQQPLEHIWVKGRVSTVGIPWSDQFTRVEPNSMPPPEWRDFCLVERGSKARYEEAYKSLVNGPDDQRVYRLCNATGTYKLDGPALYLGKLASSRSTWREMVGSIYSQRMVFDGRKFKTLDAACESITAQLRDQPNSTAPGVKIPLRCVQRNGLLVVEAAFQNAGNESSFSFEVDPRKGFNMVKYARRVGGKGQGIDHRETTEIEIEEFLPGVFFPRSGRTFIVDEGTVDKRDKTAGWSLTRFVVDDVKIGDFEYNDSNFDWKSLPIPMGAYVQDDRVSPPLTFRFGKAPLEEQVMLAALNERPQRPGLRRSSILVSLNVAVFLFICSIYIVRKYRIVRQ